MCRLRVCLSCTPTLLEIRCYGGGLEHACVWMQVHVCPAPMLVLHTYSVGIQCYGGGLEHACVWMQVAPPGPFRDMLRESLESELLVTLANMEKELLRRRL
jgi:hypothetical protein